MSLTVAGEVDWDDAKVGDLKLKDQSKIVIAWTDGTETDFDVSILGGLSR